MRQLFRYLGQSLTLSAKSETNTVQISLIVPRKDSLNNNAHEVNSRLIKICGERDITFVDHTDTTERHLNESKGHLNKSGTIVFAKNVCELLLQQDCYSGDNSGNATLGSEKSSAVLGVSNPIPEHSIHHEVGQSGSFRGSGHKPVREDPIFKESHEIPSNLNRGAPPEPRKGLEDIRRKNINRLIFAQLNINSLWNKFESLQHVINNNTDVLLISETKIDSSFLSVQFHLEGYAAPYRLDRNTNGRSILLYITEDIPSKLLNSDSSIEGFFVEIRLMKKIWLFCSSYNHKKNLIANHPLRKIP